MWLPRFPTDRIERRLPGASAEPRATVISEGHRRRLAAVNRAAETLGLVPGLGLADAEARVPELAVHPATPEKDCAALRALAAWCGRWSPWTAPEGESGLWLDVTGAAHLFGGEALLLADIAERLDGLGFAAKLAMADTPGAAWALARYGAGESATPIVAPPGDPTPLLDLPVAALRLAEAIVADLARLGFGSIGELAAAPRAALARRFGPSIGRRLDQAFGQIDEPIEPLAPQAALRIRQPFAEPIAAPEDIAAIARDLVEALCRRLADEMQGVRRLAFTLFRVDGTLVEAEIGTLRPSRDPRHLFRLLAEKLDALDPGFGIDLALIEARATDPLAPTQIALDRTGAGTDDQTDMAALVDRLIARLGSAAVARYAPHGSHIPERAVRRQGPLDADPPGSAWRADPPRPIRLFARPEPIEAVAELPDGPPALFRWRRVAHRIRRAEGPERIAAEWWRAGADELPARDYYRVEDETGRRFWLYRDGPATPEGARWFLHGLFG